MHKKTLKIVVECSLVSNPPIRTEHHHYHHSTPEEKPSSTPKATRLPLTRRQKAIVLTHYSQHVQSLGPETLPDSATQARLLHLLGNDTLPTKLGHSDQYQQCQRIAVQATNALSKKDRDFFRERYTEVGLKALMSLIPVT